MSVTIVVVLMLVTVIEKEINEQDPGLCKNQVEKQGRLPVKVQAGPINLDLASAHVVYLCGSI